MAQSLTGNPLNLFYCNLSPPAGIPDTQWTEWMASDFIPALVESKAAVRAAMYREIGFAMIPVPSYELRYMFLCQTDFRELQDSEKYTQVYDHTNAEGFMTDEAAIERGITDSYKITTPRITKAVSPPAPNMLSVEMDPEDRFDFEDWYRRELLPKLSTLKGYLRSKRYQLSGDGKTTANPFLALHEIQDLSKAFVSQKAHEEASTERMERHIVASEKKRAKHGGGFIRRGWVLIHAEGYETDLIPCNEQTVKRIESHESAIVSYWTWLSHLVVNITSIRTDRSASAKFEPAFI